MLGYKKIELVESKINPMVDALHNPLLSVPGISYRMVAIIIAETGNFANFSIDI